MGEESFTPIGATDQPPQYPPGKCGSVFMFPTTYSGEESWPVLCQTLMLRGLNAPRLMKLKLLHLIQFLIVVSFAQV